MATFTFEVGEVHYYADVISVEADNEEQAKEMIEAQLEDDPLEHRKDTFNGVEYTFDRTEE